MDWFKDTEYASSQLYADFLNNKDVSNTPLAKKGYSAAKENGYLHIVPKAGNPTDNGWKFHLSVDPSQVKDAWNVIAEDLMDAKLTAKVKEERKHTDLGNPDNDQRGKAIVIYAPDDRDISPTLKKIEQKLSNAGIKPGMAVLGDKQVGGSNYMHYRNDTDESGKYISADKASRVHAEQRYNPTNKTDPYKDLNVASNNNVGKAQKLDLDLSDPVQKPPTRPEQSDLDKASQNARAELAQVSPKPITPEFAKAAASVDARQQLADPTYKTADKPAAKTATPIEGHTKVAGSGVGLGMGVYGLTQKFGEGGTAAGDLKNKDTRIMAQAGIVADGAAILADTADGLSDLKKVSDNLKTASKASRVAAPVGVALSVASGVIDYKIADKTKDAGRASDAIGGSAGGMAGAAAGGVVGSKTGAAIGAAVGVWFGGVGAAPGAVIGGVIGGAAGAIGGAFAGSEAGKKVAEVTIKDSLQKKYDEEKRAEVTAKTDTRYKSMGMAELGKAIQKDETLPDTVKLHGKDVPLTTALEDKNFRGGLIKNLESAQAKGNELSDQIAMVKAYDEKLVAKAKAPAMTEEPVIAKNTAPSISAPMA